MQSIDTVMQLLSSYRGQRISVISSTDSRFEGWLKDICPEDQTISVEKVRFWGTESRSPGRHVGSRTELCDHIRLKLRDAKEIFVHVERAPENCTDSTATETRDAVIPILWTTVRLEKPAENGPEKCGRVSESQPIESHCQDTVDILPESRPVVPTPRPRIVLITPGKDRTVADGGHREDDVSCSGPTVQNPHVLDVVRCAMDPNAVVTTSPNAAMYGRLKGSIDRGYGESEKGSTVFDIMWSGTRSPCPIPSCDMNFFATSMYTMEQHFWKTHRTEYPNYGLRLHCPVCDDYGFEMQICYLRTHLKSKHGWENGLPPRDWEDKLLPPRSVELDGTGVEQTQCSSEESAALSNGPSSKKVVRAAATNIVSTARDQIISNADMYGRMKGSSDHGYGESENGATGATIFDVIWSGKRCACPVSSCGVNYFATSLFKMNQHFSRYHTAVYPNWKLRLHCPVCEEYGFEGKVPDLRTHLKSKHGWENGLPPRDWEDKLLPRSSMELDGTGVEQTQSFSGTSPAFINGSLAKEVVFAGGFPPASITDSSSSQAGSNRPCSVSLDDQQPENVYSGRKRGASVTSKSLSLNNAKKGKKDSVADSHHSVDSVGSSGDGYDWRPSASVEVSNVVQAVVRPNTNVLSQPVRTSVGVAGVSTYEATEQISTARDQILDKWKKRLDELRAVVQAGIDSAHPPGNADSRRFQSDEMVLAFRHGVFCKATIAEYHPTLRVPGLYNVAVGIPAVSTCIVHFYGYKNEDEERAENQLLSFNDLTGMLFAHEWNTWFRMQHPTKKLGLGTWHLSDDEFTQLEPHWQNQCGMNVPFAEYSGRQQAETALAGLCVDG